MDVSSAVLLVLFADDEVLGRLRIKVRSVRRRKRKPITTPKTMAKLAPKRHSFFPDEEEVIVLLSGQSSTSGRPHFGNQGSIRKSCKIVPLELMNFVEN